MTCEICGEPSVEVCPRCEARVCTRHGLSGERFCSACSAELTEALEDVQTLFEARSTPSPFFNRARFWSDLLHGVELALARRRIHRAFARRTPEAIRNARKS